MTMLLMMLVPYLPVVPWAIDAELTPPPPVIRLHYPLSLHFKPAQDGPAREETGEGCEEQAPRDDWGSDSGAAADGSSRSSSPPLTDAEVKKASADWEARRMGSGQWRLMLSKRMAVRGDCKVADLRRIGAWGDRFIETLERILEGEAKDLRFSIRVFAEREDFDLYASTIGAKTARSFYDAKHTEAVLYCDPKRDRRELAADLMHELVHEYMDRVFQRTGPAWLAEGMAEYFSDYTIEEGKIVPRVRSGVDDLKKALEERMFVTMRRLVGLDLSAFQSDGWKLLYGEAASLVRFLVRRDPRAAWELVRGKTVDQVGDVDVLDKAWRAAIAADEK